MSGRVVVMEHVEGMQATKTFGMYRLINAEEGSGSGRGGVSRFFKMDETWRT